MKWTNRQQRTSNKNNNNNAPKSSNGKFITTTRMYLSTPNNSPTHNHARAISHLCFRSSLPNGNFFFFHLSLSLCVCCLSLFCAASSFRFAILCFARRRRLICFHSINRLPSFDRGRLTFDAVTTAILYYDNYEFVFR